jgi:hypothetical protein
MILILIAMTPPALMTPVQITYIIQNYSEFKLDLNLTVPPDRRTMIQSDSNLAVIFAL